MILRLWEAASPHYHHSQEGGATEAPGVVSLGHANVQGLSLTPERQVKYGRCTLMCVGAEATLVLTGSLCRVCVWVSFRDCLCPLSCKQVQRLGLGGLLLGESPFPGSPRGTQEEGRGRLAWPTWLGLQGVMLSSFGLTHRQNRRIPRAAQPVPCRAPGVVVAHTWPSPPRFGASAPAFNSVSNYMGN